MCTVKYYVCHRGKMSDELSNAAVEENSGKTSDQQRKGLCLWCARPHARSVVLSMQQRREASASVRRKYCSKWSKTRCNVECVMRLKADIRWRRLLMISDLKYPLYFRRQDGNLGRNRRGSLPNDIMWSFTKPRSDSEWTQVLNLAPRLATLLKIL